MADTRRLPTPVTEVWNWQMRGSCRGMDSGFFFHPENERGPARALRETRAKEVCRRCPVIEECRRHALAAHEPYGVWGGFSEAERQRLLAVGWEDTADRYRRKVDVGALARRLGPSSAAA